MDKRVVFVVAGSGKTTLLVECLREDSRALVLTHTVNNETHLRAGIIHRFGFLPDGIRVMTWFEFLHGFCSARAAALHADGSIIKLFYRVHHRYGCFSMNWGASKGLDHFHDVCIVTGADHWRNLTRRTLQALPPSSRNRLLRGLLSRPGKYLVRPGNPSSSVQDLTVNAVLSGRMGGQRSVLRMRPSFPRRCRASQPASQCHFSRNLPVQQTVLLYRVAGSTRKCARSAGSGQIYSP